MFLHKLVKYFISQKLNKLGYAMNLCDTDMGTESVLLYYGGSLMQVYGYEEPSMSKKCG